MRSLLSSSRFSNVAFFSPASASAAGSRFSKTAINPSSPEGEKSLISPGLRKATASLMAARSDGSLVGSLLLEGGSFFGSLPWEDGSFFDSLPCEAGLFFGSLLPWEAGSFFDSLVWEEGSFFDSLPSDFVLSSSNNENGGSFSDFAPAF